VRSRFSSARRIGDPIKVIHLTLKPPPAPNAPILAAAPSSAPGFWANASTTEKVVIVGAGALAAIVLVSAFKPRRRRR
jgi:hypothetical protein